MVSYLGGSEFGINAMSTVTRMIEICKVKACGISPFSPRYELHVRLVQTWTLADFITDYYITNINMLTSGMLCGVKTHRKFPWHPWLNMYLLFSVRLCYNRTFDC